MKTLYGITLGLAISALAVSATTGTAFAAKKSQAHMGHVSKSWNDTPGKAGLLPTAVEEAKIAAFHASAAAKKSDNLKWMQTHARHVINAVDPSVEAKGPGKGYGVLKAAAGAAKHIGIAAKQGDASDNVKTHAVHVGASAQNTVDRAKSIIATAQKILAATTAKAAAPLVKQMAKVAGQLQAGFDANGDGKIGWQKGEGGLGVATKHMGIMFKGEGM